MTRFGDESLFGDPISEFAGQALGVVVSIYFIVLILYFCFLDKDF
jgi:hypothetical protein